MRIDYQAVNAFDVAKIVIEKGVVTDSFWLTVKLVGQSGDEIEVAVTFSRKSGNKLVLPPIYFRNERGEEEQLRELEIAGLVSSPDADIPF